MLISMTACSKKDKDDKKTENSKQENAADKENGNQTGDEKDSNNKKEETLEDVLQAVKDNTKDMKSATLKLLMDMTMESEGNEIAMKLDMKMQTTKEPVATYMKGTMNYLGMDMDMESYSVEEDGKMISYTGTMGSWSKTEEDEGGNASAMVGEFNLFDQCENLEISKIESLNGKDCYVIEGKITEKGMQDVLGSTTGDLGSFGADTESQQKNVSMPVKFYIDKESKMPVKMSLDLNDMLSSLMTGSEETKDVTGNYIFDLEFLSFNDVEPIVVPEDVKNGAVAQ